ncbi:MAG: oligosaccharide flippase family protein [Calditrichaeota bacterium]|nr:oligosaccharide flippase family protein [Calditrichota bacterium]
MFTYLIVRLLLKTLSIEEYGLYSLLLLGALWNYSPLFQFGIPNVLNRFIPEYYASSRLGLIVGLFKSVVKTQFAIAVGAALLVIALAEPMSKWINYPDSAQAIRIFAIGGIAFMMSRLYQSVLDGMFRQHTTLIISVTFNTLRLIGIFIVAQYFPTLVAVFVVEVILLASNLGIYVLAYYHKAFGNPLRNIAGETPAWKPIRKFGLLSYLNELGVSLLSMATDLILISSIAGGLAAGYFALAHRIRDLVVKFLPEQLLAPVATPLFFSEYGTDSARSSANFGFALLTKATLFISLSVGIWLALMARPVIVHLFDPEYAQADSLLIVMAVFVFGSSLRFPLGLVLQNAERVDLMIYSKATALLKIALGLWLLPKYGVIAMVWITELAILAQDGVMYYFIWTRIGHRGDPVGILKLLLNSAIAAGLFYLITPYFDSLIGVIVSPIAFVIIYFGVNIVHKPFRKEERDFINAHIKYPVWKF